MANQSAAGTHLGAARQHQVASLAHEHAAIFHQLLTVEEGEASEQVADLPLPALEEKGKQEVTQRAGSEQEVAQRRSYRVRPVDHLDDVFDVDVVLLRVQRHGEVVVLPAVHCLVADGQDLPVHVQHLPQVRVDAPVI